MTEPTAPHSRGSCSRAAPLCRNSGTATARSLVARSGAVHERRPIGQRAHCKEAIGVVVVQAG